MSPIHANDAVVLPEVDRPSVAFRGACRFCGTPLHRTFVDLGMSPLCESYVDEAALNGMEMFFPLRVFVCDHCFLVQLQEYVSREDIFTEYAYYSSYSDSWVAHARRYVDSMAERFALGPTSRVVEVGSNDGYLLQYFVERRIPCFGIEPAANVARAAAARGVDTRVEFFGREVARRLAHAGESADLLLGNNVLAQVNDLNDFVGGLKIALAPQGVITIEFPHLMRLVEQNQFDTIYHEHFSYFSFLSARGIFAAHGLVLFDVEELATHGGSLRIYARHQEDASKPVTGRAQDLAAREERAGILDLPYYESFAERVRETKRKILEFLIGARRGGKKIVGYGAPGKGNTLLNYCGIGTDFVDFTVDRNPYKQGKYLPGTHIPILPPEALAAAKPDYVFVLPWNLKDEIVQQLEYIHAWGGRLVLPIPELQVL